MFLDCNSFQKVAKRIVRYYRLRIAHFYTLEISFSLQYLESLFYDINVEMIIFIKSSYVELEICVCALLDKL